MGCEKDDPHGTTPPPRIIELTQATDWTFLDDPSRDVFADMRPDDLVCDPILAALQETYGADPVFELDTDDCGFITVEAATQAAATTDYTIQLRVGHYALTAPEPAEAHLALAIDGEVAWDETLPIPSEQDVLEYELPIDHDLPEGTPLQFHVHNHGNNAYDIFDIMATRND